jgi:CDP-6-deoxy-D-xylo-4-hexulose-3-dehydrase
MAYGGTSIKKFTPITDRIAYGGAMIDQRERDAINRVIDSQGGRRWTLGEESLAFEKELAEATGVKRAVVVNSGSSALLVAIACLKLPKGSKIIIPAVNFPTAFNAILQNGHIPVVVDVCLETFNIDVVEVEKALSLHPDIAAIIVVDIAANPVDLLQLRRIIGNKDIRIILDNCDGYGTKLQDRFIDVYADISCVSFHAAHIITTGEGGAILTNHTEIADRAIKIREWGRESGSDRIYDYPGFPNDYRERYVYTEIGYNLKPLELQCAMGRIQLKKLPDFRFLRLNNFAHLVAVFHKLPTFQLVDYPPSALVCWFSFPILCDGIARRKVMDTLEANNIECRTIFSGNITKHPAYQEARYIQIGNLVHADRVMRDGMFLSVHPSITPEMISFIEKVINTL